MFDIVLLARFASNGTPSSPFLGLVVICSSALDVTEMRNSDHHIFLFDQVFNPDFVVEVGDFRFSLVTKFFLDFSEFSFDDIIAFPFIGQQFFEVVDQLHDFLKLFPDLLNFHSGKALQPQFKYRFSLNFRHAKFRHQPFLGPFGIGCTADQLNNCVEVVERNQVTL